MCGFAGFWGYGNISETEIVDLSHKMGKALEHRGPDAEGYWRDNGAEISLVHRRLAIVELSDAGHQPMMSASGRYVLVFNGEIYNHSMLRETLDRTSARDGAKHRWCGGSDTETLLVSIERWGLEGALQQCNGMFAIALWDRTARTLYLARDRMGEKPVYYGWQNNGVFIFGSELKALRLHPAFDHKISPESIPAYLKHSYIPAPKTIYDGMLKLRPGCILTVRDPVQRKASTLVEYWRFPDCVTAGRRDRFSGTDSEAVSELDRILTQAVCCQTNADVPVGAFLSGGIDSSLVASMMQRNSSVPINTFTIGFEEASFSEAGYASTIARHIGSDHTELILGARDAREIITKLPQVFDEPFADSSQIPTYIVSKLARTKVTVCLSGDGADELFGGYGRYGLANRLWRTLTLLPGFGPRRLYNNPRMKVSERGDYEYSSAHPIAQLLGADRIPSLYSQRIRRLFDLLGTSNLEAFYLQSISHLPLGRIVNRDFLDGGTSEVEYLDLEDSIDPRESFMAIDAVTYLPDDILCKVDRAAMSNSLETRMPFLSKEVVDFAWRLPPSMKFRGKSGKWILHQVLARYVPAQMFQRKKMGFAVPLRDWLRGPLREWAEDLLGEARLKHDGIFRPRPIRMRLEQHMNGTRDWHTHLWDVLMFNAWLDEQKNGRK
jgi:asparagine synthase (glutamine-hydrolysing)